MISLLILFCGRVQERLGINSLPVHLQSSLSERARQVRQADAHNCSEGLRLIIQVTNYNIICAAVGPIVKDLFSLCRNRVRFNSIPRSCVEPIDSKHLCCLSPGQDLIPAIQCCYFGIIQRITRTQGAILQNERRMDIKKIHELIVKW